MDSITHIVLGAAQGELLAGKKLGKRAMLWGAAANSLPDIDVVFGGLIRLPDTTFSHRGITHSFLFIIIFSLLLGYLFYRYNKKGVSLTRWIMIFGVGLLTHITIDALTTYGTGWFEPFSHYRVSFNTIFVADPFYTFPLIISFIALLILKRNSPRRNTWNAWGLMLSSIYMLFTFYNKYEVDKTVKENLAQQNIHHTDYFTTPTPLNNFLWYAVVKDTNQFHLGYYSILDNTKSIPFHIVRANDSWLDEYRDESKVQKLIRSSEGYYCLTKTDSGEVDFNDLRFGQVGGWTNPDADFVFCYPLKKTSEDELIIQKGRFRSVSGDAAKELFERIKGR